jgi:hypothetical protein
LCFQRSMRRHMCSCDVSFKFKVASHGV